MVSHLPSKKPQNRRSALRTSTWISCPSPVLARLGLRPRQTSLQTDRGHGPKPMRAGNDRVLAVERQASSAVRGSQSDVAQHLVRVREQVELR